MTTEWSWVLCRVDAFGLTLSPPSAGSHVGWGLEFFPDQMFSAPSLCFFCF